MIGRRKKVVIDKRFQYSMSIKAIVLPLTTILLISAVLLYYAFENQGYVNQNNRKINEIVSTQHTMIEMFLETPALYNSKNTVVRDGDKTFKKNIGKLKEIKDNSTIIVKNSKIVLYFLLIMTIVQTAIIFILFLFFSHKISGPVYVIRRYLHAIRNGEQPEFRPLRKRDEFKELYQEFRDTVEFLCKDKK